MRLHFDDQIFLSQAVGGVSRYFAELIRAYSGDESFGVSLVSPRVFTVNEHLADAGGSRRLPAQLGRHRRLAQSFNRSPRKARAADIVHHTYYDRKYLSRFNGAGVRVITIYDMIPEIFPHLFPSGSPHRDKLAFVEAADLILCISEATRRDLIKIYGLPKAPIVVTPLGVDRSFQPQALRPQVLPQRYVLYVGRRGGYKDFHVLAQAFASADIPRDVILVVVGGGRFEEAEFRRLVSLGISDRVLRLDLDDANLAGAYAHAHCFVFPSRYEGFGLPTLEAMASGCPVILAASSSHPEVGGDAALYFPPGDDGELAQVLRQVTIDTSLREQSRTDGLARATKFSWSHTAQRTAAAYHSALNSR